MIAKTNKQCPWCGKRHIKYPQACLTATRNYYGYALLASDMSEKRVSAKRLLAEMSAYARENWVQEA